MRKIATLFLAVAIYVLMGIGGAAAADDKSKKMQKPDSIVTCQAGFPAYEVAHRTAPASVNLDQCIVPSTQSAPECAPCIRSLENQGCKVVDVIVTHFVGEGESRASFLLSCEKP